MLRKWWIKWNQKWRWVFKQISAAQAYRKDILLKKHIIGKETMCIKQKHMVHSEMEIRLLIVNKCMKINKKVFIKKLMSECLMTKVEKL
jgi:hypothetical protein